MIFLDTNVIVDLLNVAKDDGGDWSRKRYAALVEDDTMGCNHVVLAELSARAASLSDLLDDLDRFVIDIVDLSSEAAFAAGRAHQRYRRRGGGREAILADFLIAGHAEALGAALMTRDRRLATYFPDLPLITPETHP